MAIVDIIVIALLAIFAIIGLVKGFFKELFSLIGTAGSVALAIVFAKPVSAFLNSLFNMVAFFTEKLSAALIGSLPAITGEVTREAVITELNGMGGVAKYLQYFMNSETLSYSTTEALCTEISTTLAGIISIVISVVILFILIRIVLALLSKLFTFITKAGLGKGIDKTLGFVFGLAKGALIVCVVFAIVYILRGVPFIADAVDNVINTSVVTKWGWVNVSSWLETQLASIDFNALIQQIFSLT